MGLAVGSEAERVIFALCRWISVSFTASKMAKSSCPDSTYGASMGWLVQKLKLLSVKSVMT